MAEQPALRKQLLRWLLVPLSVLLAVDTFVSYRVALEFAQRAYDRSLVEIARDLSLHLRRVDGTIALELSEEARTILFGDPIDRIRFQIVAPDGRTVDGEPIASAAANARRPEAFSDGEVGGEPVRIVELLVPHDARSGRPGAVVRVAETQNKRRALAREILLSVVVPQALLILVAGVVVWVGVVHGLAPLDRLRRALTARSHRDASPVVAEGVPAEVQPFLDAINELVARLDLALTLQNRFIADAAHQLKTPLAALQAQLELAMRERDSERSRLAMEEAHRGLERLSRVVSQLLSLARNEPEAAGAIAFSTLDLRELALEVTSDWVPRALARDVDLGFEGGEAPVLVRGNAGRLRELFDNLLDNAVRYSRGMGRVTVRVTGDPTPTVDVNDDGPGIPPQERRRVFERFHRLLGNTQEGSGLGLAIAQEIAAIHGARIELRDDPDGIGNTFSVVFPRP